LILYQITDYNSYIWLRNLLNLSTFYLFFEDPEELEHARAMGTYQKVKRERFIQQRGRLSGQLTALTGHTSSLTKQPEPVTPETYEANVAAGRGEEEKGRLRHHYRKSS
jgi:hypothetical protein